MKVDLHIIQKLEKGEGAKMVGTNGCSLVGLTYTCYGADVVLMDLSVQWEGPQGLVVKV